MIDLTRRHVIAATATSLMLPGSVRAAPSAGVPPTSWRMRLGAFTVTNLSDAGVMIDGPWPIVGENRERSEVEALMRANDRPPDRFMPGFSPTVVQTGRETVLFDAGNGAVGFVPRPAGGQLAQRLGQSGLSPEAVDLVVLTHCHTDHIGGLMEAGRPVFPNARYVVGAREFAFWQDDARLAAPEVGNEYKSARIFRSHLLPLAERIRFLEPGDTVVPGIDAVAAFGHTPGHLAFNVESEGRRMLVWGDCAHHEIASLVRPDWHALFDMDKNAGVATRRAIYDMAATDRVLVAGYHTAFPSLGHVTREGLGYRWVPLTDPSEL